MSNKGREFKGWTGGACYKALAAVFGIGPRFDRRGVGEVHLKAGMKALDLGCGPGALSYALAEKADAGATIVGIDISEDQLDYARKHSDGYSCGLEFQRVSMDELPFPDADFDLVMSSMALHETPPAVRRAAVAETARVLKPGGLFLLVDWSRPKLGFRSAVWLPIVCWGERNRDNWNNVYLELCEAKGLSRVENLYLTSIARRQVFRKEVACEAMR